MDVLVTDIPTLIGDFLGCLPALQALAETEDVYIPHVEECEPLYKLIPNSCCVFPKHVEAIKHRMPTMHIDLSEAFSDASKHNLYMSQAFFKQLGLHTPVLSPKAKLKYTQCKYTNQYFISPFARSLPEEQKWAQHQWNLFVLIHPDKQFVVLGNTTYDVPNFITGSNVRDCYDKPLTTVAGLLKASNGLISVVTGTSHLAFHLGVRNIVLNNQNMTWGTNPEGIHIRTPIQQLKPHELNEYL